MTHRGETHYKSKLTEDDVRQLLRYVERRNRLRAEASRLSNANLAKQYGLHVRTIEKAIAGFTWSHVAEV